MTHIIVWLSPVVIHGMHLILLQLVVLDLNPHLVKRIHRHPMENHPKLFLRKRLHQGHHHQGQIHKCKTVSNFHYYRLIYHDCSYLIINYPKIVNKNFYSIWLITSSSRTRHACSWKEQLERSLSWKILCWIVFSKFFCIHGRSSSWKLLSNIKLSNLTIFTTTRRPW